MKQWPQLQSRKLTSKGCPVYSIEKWAEHLGSEGHAQRSAAQHSNTAQHAHNNTVSNEPHDEIIAATMAVERARNDKEA